MIFEKPGERVEQLRVVRAEFRAAREQAQVRVEPRRFLVVVSGTEMHVAAQTVFVFAHHRAAI